MKIVQERFLGDIQAMHKIVLSIRDPNWRILERKWMKLEYCELEVSCQTSIQPMPLRIQLFCPNNYIITKLVVLTVHQRLLHAGVDSGLYEDHNGKEGLHSFPTFKMFRLKATFALSAPLPKNRIEQFSLCEVTGIDFAGSSYTKGEKTKKFT